MTRENNHLKEVKPYSNIYVTFGDGVRGKFMGKGKLDYPDLPSLEDFILVEGLNANLISIIQLCDQEIFVKLNHYECIFTNNILEQIMKCTRSSNNYYLWISQSKDQPPTCLVKRGRNQVVT